MIIGVTDEPPSLVDAWVRDNEPAYPIVSLKPGNALEQHLQIEGFPTAAVIAPDGKITYKDHFDYDDALEAAHDDAEKVPLWPKAFKRVHKEVLDQDLPAAYAQLGKVLDKRLDDDERAFGERARAWLEAQAAEALAAARSAVESGDVYTAEQLVEPFVDGKQPFPEHQEMESFLEELEERPHYKDELRAGEMFAEARVLARSKRTVEDAIELLDKLVARYDADEVALVNRARDMLDQLEEYRDD